MANEMCTKGSGLDSGSIQFAYVYSCRCVTGMKHFKYNLRLQKKLQFHFIKVAVGPKRSTNRNLKEIITIECARTVILQLLWPLGISKLAKRELIQ